MNTFISDSKFLRATLLRGFSFGVLKVHIYIYIIHVYVITEF